MYSVNKVNKILLQSINKPSIQIILEYTYRRDQHLIRENCQGTASNSVREDCSRGGRNGIDSISNNRELVEWSKPMIRNQSKKWPVRQTCFQHDSSQLNDETDWPWFSLGFDINLFWECHVRREVVYGNQRKLSVIPKNCEGSLLWGENF